MTTRAKTLVGTPDRDSIRRARLAWIVETLRLPLHRARQAARQAGSLRGRHR